MHVERDMAKVTLPFVIGIVISACSCIARCNAASASALSLSLCFLLSCTLIADRSVFRKDKVRWILLIGIMLFCGIFIGSSDILLSISKSETHGPLNRIALDFAERLKASFMSIPFDKPETSGIINALITGEKSGITTEVKEAFRASGASHILALSGLHLGMIYIIIRRLLTPAGNTPSAKILKSAITISSCCFYTLATGAGPSIVRALLFIIIREIVALTHRRSSLASTMMTAMIIQLIMNPSSIKEAGFQLSYAAVCGITFIYPRLRAFWPGTGHEDDLMTRILRWIWNSAALSISCQITTGPLAYAYFDSFPLHFLLTNLVALPLTGLIIPAALLTMMTTELGCCPDILIRATEALVTALSAALNIISTM